MWPSISCRSSGGKKLLWPLAIIVGTFVANFFFGVNIMLLVVIDGLLGLVFLRGAAYGK
jgi:chromate transporter